MHFFPPLYPDELLYSAFARYHAYSGNESCKKTMRDLFASKTVCAVTDLPCHLDILSQRIPGRAISKETLLYNHTLLPYYRSFMPKERLENIIFDMLYRDGRSVHMKVGLTASGVKNPQKLKYCSTCVENDRERYGVAYWHRSHQLPGVIVCHKHHVLLVDSNIPFASRRNKHEYVSLETIVESGCPQGGSVTSNHDLYIAQLSHKLLCMNIDSPIRLDQLRDKYLSRMQAYNLLTCMGRIKFRALVPRFIEYYGDDVLKRLGSQIELNKQDTWIHKVLRSSTYVCHPLRHILLHGFFRMDIESVFHNKDMVSISHPFGTGPWLCLNKAANHYREAVIPSCKVTRCYNTGKPVGTFRCGCGFVYSRRGPDEFEEDKMKIGRIKEFGEVWTEKLRTLSSDYTLSLREMARQLGVDPVTVKRRLKLQTTKTLESIVLKDKDNGKLEIVLEKRNLWLDMRNQKVSPFRLSVYVWLYKNDRDWLIQNKPTKSKITAQYVRVDWEQRDKEVASKVQEIAIRLKPLRKVRISKSEIGRRIGSLALLSHHLDKMPETHGALERVVESTEKYQIRRIKLAIKELKSQKYIVKEWEVAKVAGLRKEAFEQLKGKISRLLNNLG